MRVSWRSRALVTIAAIGIVATACSNGSGSSASAGTSAAPSAGASSAASPAASTSGAKGNGETINIAVNPWVGYESNAAVIGYLLQNQLNYKVEFKNLTEQISWQGFASGDVDVIVENWGHDELVKTYITEKKVAEDAGQTGVTGRHRLVRPAVDGRQVPGHHRLEQPQQVRRPVQDAPSPAARASSSTATRPT